MFFVCPAHRLLQHEAIISAITITTIDPHADVKDCQGPFYHTGIFYREKFSRCPIIYV